MDVFYSPIDALVFDYVSFGILNIVNNLWTWVAVITAAVSFWRIRAAGAGHGAVKTLEAPSPSSNCIERSITEPSLPETTSTPESVTEAAARGSVSSSPSAFEHNGVTKGKFVVNYYQEDDRENDGNNDGEEEEEEEEEELTVFGEWGRFGGELTLWERMLRVRIGDYGWHRCQDLTVTNGNVVRLWDGVRREKYSSGCGVW